MDQPGIVKLIKKGESKTVEFKETFDNKTIETAVAFANTKGGHVFIGVSDQGIKKGIQVGKETLMAGLIRFLKVLSLGSCRRLSHRKLRTK